jgi:hypothetical protein
MYASSLYLSTGEIRMRQTISLPPIYTKKLKTEKKATGQNMSEIIRRALDLYFKEKERGNV